MPIKRKNRTGHRSQQAQAGFTLVELMVVVAVVGVLAVVAAPSMAELVRTNRVNGAAGELTSAIQVARSEAIRRNSRVWVCPTDGSATATTVCSNSGTWAQWAILDLSKTNAGERVIRNETPPASVQISGPAAGFMFRPSGITDAQVAVCTKSASYPAANQRELTVLISGVISTDKVCD